ncbi:MAG: hypothetical protein AAF402_13540 [Pseudomonadota bacterium]
MSQLYRFLGRLMRPLAAVAILLPAAVFSATDGDEQEPIRFQRVPLQFIAALGDPEARSGSGAENWGIWKKDPGPRGVWHQEYDALMASGGVAPSNWVFDNNDWWLEENGILMEHPQFSVEPGQYLVTGDREVVTVLTIHPPDANGDRRWELANGAKLYDVTHLPCRSARYTPIAGNMSCLPSSANHLEFPVTPGAVMPDVPGCLKQDYAVLFVIGVAV